MSNHEGETTKEQIKHNAVKQKAPRLRLSVVITLLITMLALALGSIGGILAYKAVQEAAQRGTTLGQQVQIACAEASTPAQKQALTANGKDLCPQADKVVDEAPPAASPTTNPTAGPTVVISGQPAPPPTYSQLFTIVADFCSRPKNCSGPKITEAEVKAALVAICGDCRGEPGESITGSPGVEGSPGASGAPGAQGSTGPEGKQGPGPTPEQILAGIETYCKADASNCTSEVVCPSGEPTSLEVRVRTEDPLEDRWQIIQTCV